MCIANSLQVSITSIAAQHIDRKVFSQKEQRVEDVLEIERQSLQTTVADWLEFSTSDYFVIQRLCNDS